MLGQSMKLPPARERCPMPRPVRQLRAAARAWPAALMNAATCPNNRNVRSSQMLLLFARCRDRDRDDGMRPAATTKETVAKKRHRAMNTGKPQLPD